MEESNLFYQFYDTLFKAKDYLKETKMVFWISQKYGLKKPKKILEVGCGTGNHTILLSKNVKTVTAIDIDQNMVNLAGQKIKELKLKNIQLKKTRIENLKDRNFDLIIALFNVVSYLPDSKALNSFTKVAARKLKKGGLLVFDLWNGIAATLDPPRTKITEVKIGSKKIKCILTPKTDFFNQIVELNYKIFIYNGKKIEKKDNFSINQTLWTPMQVRDSINNSGMEVVFCSPLLKPDKVATKRDWKIMFCAKKSK